jgi:hypothetical protein
MSEYEPESNDESHSGIHGIGRDDPRVPDLIAEKFQESYPAIRKKPPHP